jgi:uncharacterized membrane protein YfcA
MDGLIRFFLARIILQLAVLVFAIFVALFCWLIDVKIEKHGNKSYFVRKTANSVPPWVSVGAFGAVTGVAFLAMFLVSRRKSPPNAPPTPTPTQTFPAPIRKPADRAIDRALPAKPRPPSRKGLT